MKLEQAFTYWYKDPKWAAKLLIGGLISLVPILNFSIMGWANEIIRRVAQDDAEPMPAWDNLGKYFMQGLVLAVAVFIYSLPAAILGMLFFIPVAAGLDGSQSDAASSMMTITVIVLTCCVTFYALLLTLVVPAIQVNYAQKETFGSCFALGDIIKIITTNLGSYLVAWLAYLLFTVVASLVIGLVITALAFIICIGWVIAGVIGAALTPLLYAVYGHLFGQIAAKRAEAM